MILIYLFDDISAPFFPISAATCARDDDDVDDGDGADGVTTCADCCSSCLQALETTPFAYGT